MLQKSSISETAGLFFSNPTRTFYLMEISKRIGLAHTSVKKCIGGLLQEGIVTQSLEKKGKRNFPLYRANINSKEYKKHKKIFNYDSVLQSGIIEFLEEKLMPKSIVLFGSFRKGEDTEDSDIDIFVECNKKEIDVSTYAKKLNRKVQLHFKEYFNSYPKELKNNIVNGIVLYGFLEAYK